MPETDQQVSIQEVERSLSVDQKNETQVEAEKRISDCFKALDTVLVNQEAPAGAKVSAAKLVLEHATGRPSTQKQRTGDSSGVTVYIQMLGGDGAVRQLVQSSDPPVVVEVTPDRTVGDETPF